MLSLHETQFKINIKNDRSFSSLKCPAPRPLHDLTRASFYACSCYVDCPLIGSLQVSKHCFAFGLKSTALCLSPKIDNREFKQAAK